MSAIYSVERDSIFVFRDVFFRLQALQSQETGRVKVQLSTKSLGVVAEWGRNPDLDELRDACDTSLRDGPKPSRVDPGPSPVDVPPPDSLWLYRCVHCRCVTVLQLNDEQGECACGAEFYPEFRRVIRGQQIPLAAIGGAALAEDDEDDEDDEGAVMDAEHVKLLADYLAQLTTLLGDDRRKNWCMAVAAREKLAEVVEDLNLAAQGDAVALGRLRQESKRA